MQTDLNKSAYRSALLFPNMKSGVSTDITIGEGVEYDFEFAMENDSSYGNLMLAHDGKRIGYRVRQELNQIYTAYGYNNFRALNIVPGKIFTVSQKGTDTYVDGKLIMRNVVQNLEKGKLYIGRCRMFFFGMTIREEGEVTHVLEPSNDGNGNPCILDRNTGKQYYPDDEITYGYLRPGSTEFTNMDPVKALMFPKIFSGISTDITMDLESDYDFRFSLDNANSYGNLMLTTDGKRIGYRVRQELSQIYTAYGYNNFSALDIVPGQVYTVSQRGDDTYVDGKLVMHNVTQDFEPGKLTIGDCRMKFYGMTVSRDGKVTHELVPSVDESGKPCILDEITGKKYYSDYEISYIE